MAPLQSLPLVLAHVAVTVSATLGGVFLTQALVLRSCVSPAPPQLQAQQISNLAPASARIAHTLFPVMIVSYALNAWQTGMWKTFLLSAAISFVIPPFTARFIHPINERAAALDKKESLQKHEMQELQTLVDGLARANLGRGCVALLASVNTLAGLIL